MRAKFQCALCEYSRGWETIKRATKDEKLRMKAAIELFRFMAEEFSSDSIPAWIGSMKDRLIREITGNPDPYKEVKERDNERALKLLPSIRAAVRSKPKGFERFREACKASVIGNAADPDVLGHEYDVSNAITLLSREEFAIDHTKRAYSLIKGKKVMLVADNAGEIAFDVILVEQLKEMGCEVVVAVKEKPVLNDATIEDAVKVGIDRVADKLVTTGSDVIGLFLNEVSDEFLKELEGCDVIIAKGMGCYESITEQNIGRPVLILFRVKCDPVAEDVGAKRGDNIALLLEK